MFPLSLSDGYHNLNETKQKILTTVTRFLLICGQADVFIFLCDAVNKDDVCCCNYMYTVF